MNELSFDSSSPWNDIHIGVTTQDEVRSLFGKPTDIQVSSAGHVTSESWSYVSTHAARQPLQYLPFLGSLAINTSTSQEPFAISFSQGGIVDGLTVSRFQVQGSENDGRPSFDLNHPQPTYGMKNPYVQQVTLTRIRH